MSTTKLTLKRIAGIGMLGLAVLGIPARLFAQTYQVILNFWTAPATEGSYPSASLLLAGDGALYGTTFYGGRNNLGTIFKLNPDGSGYTVLKSFAGSDGSTPGANVIQASDGALYGTTVLGGGSNGGVLFKLNPDGTGYTVLKNFTDADGFNPFAGVIQASDGLLYGTTRFGGSGSGGTVFRVNLDGTGYTVLKNFYYMMFGGGEGYPFASLLQGGDGVLYGTLSAGGSSDGGLLFRLNLDGGGYTVLKVFTSADGTNPRSQLIQSGDGTLFGTTVSGGASGQGTLFRVSPDGSGYSVLKNFNIDDGSNPYAGLIQANDGVLYGTTTSGGSAFGGTAFRVGSDGTGYTVLKNFSSSEEYEPLASLIQGCDGMLYGTASLARNAGYGAVFKLNSDGSEYTVLKRFFGTDASHPSGSLLQASDGALYGATAEGGSVGRGTVFKVGLDGTGYTLLKSFQATDGRNAYAGLLQAADGALYGATAQGGEPDDYGTLYKINPDGTGYTLLKTFTGSDGRTPNGNLIQASNGMIYGTTYAGGTGIATGTLFEINPDGTGYTVLEYFSSADGVRPRDGLLQASNGALYGTASDGGTGGGTLFRMNLDGSAYAILRNFTELDGRNSSAGLILASDGALYGTTGSGGTGGWGTIFRVDPDGDHYTVLKSFSNTEEGYSPGARLLQASDGALYGTTSGGRDDSTGTIFKINLDGSGYTVLKNFNGSDGRNPTGGLIQASDGALYGVTLNGGTTDAGVLFRLTPSP